MPVGCILMSLCLLFSHTKWKIFGRSNDIKAMVSLQCATIKLLMHLGVCYALMKLESHLASTSCDSNASFVLSNIPCVSMTWWFHAISKPLLMKLMWSSLVLLGSPGNFSPCWNWSNRKCSGKLKLVHLH